jgi:GDP-L-fucose synthase
MREFLFVEDLAEACIFLLSRPLTELRGACSEPEKILFNIGTGEDVTIGDLAHTVADLVGYSGEVVWDADKPDGTPRKLLDVSRMTALGWKAKTRLNEGIRTAYTQYLTSLEG